MQLTEQLDRARRVIADLRKRLAEFQAAGTEPVAVVGMACRFPGEARDVAGYWDMVAAGRNAIGPVPGHRARDMAADRLKPVALLDDIEHFDAAFFDISPREAAQMDPQQRVLLETGWAALEDAGQTRSNLAGSQTAVFVGVHNHSSGYLELQTAELSRLNEYTATGSGHDVIAGRFAYVFDMRGPSAVINTACSSSLVAVHIACQSLLARDCRMAVAGGVNLILGPMQGRILSLGGMLAPDGRCKTFDARADGYGRGEGCGVVVLKRLSDAIEDRDRVLAIIRGSAVNQDGRTNGLTAPSGLAQAALLRRTLARAGLEASRIGYIEAHGTGTALGDPIEVEALASVYGMPDEGGSRCALGSAKANINHLEGAAGIAGLIKTILTLRARVIPPVAGFERLNPHLSLDGTRLFIPTAAAEWQSEAPRVAAVSAFGWSGTNAHLLIEEAPEKPLRDADRPTVIMVSASDPSALSARASVLAEALQSLPDEALESFAWTATARRSHSRFRLAAAGRDRAELAEALREAACRDSVLPSGTQRKIGFLIGDDAVAAAEFGAELMGGEAVFRNVVAGCAAAFEAVGEKTISAALAGPWADMAADRVRCFVFALGVAAVLERWGVRPAATAGWGIGTLAAAHLSGDMTLAEAVRRVAHERDMPDRSTTEAGLAMAGIDHVVRVDKLVRIGAAAVPGDSARLRLMRILVDLANAGFDLVWDEVFGPMVQLVDLPAHRFRRRRHWVAEPSPPEATPSASSADVPPGWFFETVWRPVDEGPVAPGDPPRRWLILGEAEGPAARLAALLRERDRLVLVEGSPGSGDSQLADVMGRGRWVLVDLRALDRRSGTVAAEAMRLSRQVVALDRALDRAPAALEVKLWLVTRGAQGVAAGEAPDLAAAPLWGLGRSLSLDHPERWGGFVDLDPAAAFDAGQLFREIAADGNAADEIAFRADIRHLNRILSAPAPAVDTLRLDPTATYLVTGAFGGIGPELAMWLARRGARSLVLTGRSLDESAVTPHPSQTLRRQLQDIGVEIGLQRCDVGDREDVAALFEGIRRAGMRLRGIFHAAAAATEPVAVIRDSDIAAAFRSKVDGGLLLDEHSRAFDLDFFVLFSSAAGVLGARGQGHYAAANAFLDALAVARRAGGLPGLSIGWGLWDNLEASQAVYFRRVGLDPMAPLTALDAMARLMSEQTTDRRDSRPLVAALDGDRLRSALESRGRARFLSALSPTASVDQSGESRVLRERLCRAPDALRRQMLSELIAAEARSVLELAPEDAFSVDRGFFELGMDSLMTVALKALLEDLFGMSLPSTLTLDYPSVAALVGYFEPRIAGTAPADTAAANAGEAGPAVEPVRAVDELSDDEVSDALAEELKALDLEFLE